MIPQNIIDQVIESANIVDVLSEFMSLKKKGVNYTGNCPFHNEKTPSFMVSQAKGIYKCFGCGVGGNVIKFVQEHEKLSYPQAIKYVANKYNITIPEAKQTPEQLQQAKKHEEYIMLYKMATEFFQSQLPNSEAHKYMASRNFANTDFEAFNIGYSPNSWDAFLKHANKLGYSSKALHSVGLIGKNENSYYDKFKNRVIFPIKNLTGQVVGFTGRILNDDKNQAKYLNTAETSHFKKGNLLYALSHAKRFINKEGSALLVEGNTDVMRWHQLGLKNTVATCGTALTEHHARLIRRFSPNLTIVFDGDSAGLKAAMRGIEVCVANGLAVSVAVLPQGEDPDSFGKKHNNKTLKDWIENEAKDFILFRTSMAQADIEGKPAEKAKLINDLLQMVKSVPDLATRETYFAQVAALLDIDKAKFEKGILDTNSEELFGIEANADAIKKANEVILCNSKDAAMKLLDKGTENVVAFEGKTLSAAQLGLILDSTKNLVVDYYFEVGQTGQESKEIKQFKKLVEQGISVKVNTGETILSLLDYYVNIYYGDYQNLSDAESQTRIIEAVAEFLSRHDNSIIHTQSASIAKRFGVSKADFNKVMKPFLDRKKGTVQQRNEEIVVDGTPHHYDIDNLPSYVDRKFLTKFKHFPVENKGGKQIFYMFQNESGTLGKVGNFYMEPQFHVIHDDPKKDKRIVKLNHAEINQTKYCEVPSNDMIEFGAFRKFLFRQGPYLLTGGKTWHLDMILNSIALKFPVTYELEIFGQQPEGFYAFSNAIVADGEIKHMNDLGLINHKERTYYSPSVSVIHKDARQDNDHFAQQRTFTYKEGNPNITFERWSNLLVEVYKYNSNGHWALLMAILSAFRSEIFPIGRLFTTLFLTGPTECGKSQIAISIRSLFFDRDAPLYNLNSGTDASMYTLLEKYRDAPVVMEEYNDMQISDNKFQGLKAAVYDGEGKTKRKDATSRDLDQSEVNAAPILLGQEAPERDDNSLQNRAIMCPVKKKDDWSEEERNNFVSLKDWEKQGLTHILVEILKQRPSIKKHYAKKLRIVEKELQRDLVKAGLPYQTRILNTISLFLALVKVFEEHIDNLKLPFTYEEFYQIARAKLVSQSESITSSNRLSVFFEKVVSLSEDQRNGIKFGKEYKIEILDEIQLRVGRDKYADQRWENPKRLLFIRLDQVHDKYKRLVGDDEYLKMNNLRNYLNDHPAFIGNVKQTRFVWEDETRVKDGNGIVVSKMQQSAKRTSAAVFDYDLLNIDMGNQTFESEEPTSPSTEEEATPEKPTQWKQKEMEFDKGKKSVPDDSDPEKLPF